MSFGYKNGVFKIAVSYPEDKSVLHNKRIFKTKNLYKKMKKDTFSFLLLAAAIISIDRISKEFLLSWQGGIIHFVKNYGHFFGLLNLNKFLVIPFYIILLTIFSYYLFRIKKSQQKLAFVLIISGLIANLIDKILFGYTIDFISLGFWPVFNIADISIVLGVLISIINLLKTSNDKPAFIN
jgi:signal peptidase II